MRRVINSVYGFGNALQFDGLNDSVVSNGAEPDNLFNTTTGFTLSFWLRLPSIPVSGSALLISKSPGTIGLRVTITTFLGNMAITVRGTNASSQLYGKALASIPPTSDGWRHIVARCPAGYTAGATVLPSLAVANGVIGAGWAAATVINWTSGIASSAPFRLGQTTASNTSYRLDDVAVYGRALSDTECLWLWNNGHGNDPLLLGPDLCYKLNETAGPTVSDSSGNGYNGTMVNFTGSPFTPH